MYRLAIIFVVLALIWVCPTALAVVPRQESAVPTVSYNPETYCGIYSLYLAARSLGLELKFNDLLKPQYISSRQGSSLGDLILAAKEQHLYSEPMGRMSCNVLRYAHCPVILHIKNDLATDKEYNHWVLFAGTEEGKARIHDGARPMELMDFTDLAARWDGVGLLISDSPISVSSLWLAVIAQFVFYAGACAGVIALLLCVQLQLPSKLCWASNSRCWHRFVGELVILLVLAVVLGAGFRWVHAGGFLSAPRAVAAIQDMHLGDFLRKVNVEEVPKLLDSEGVTIVDARLPQDFAAGHLARAINLPPSSSAERCQQALAGVPTSSRILLYCQSNGCLYSEIVARKLIALGYSNILYFRDGWISWEKYQQVPGR
jgi:rhodanese-related sulfurtransferase